MRSERLTFYERVKLINFARARTAERRCFACSELRPDYLSGPLAHQLFEQAAASTPEARCLTYEGQEMSYQQVS